MIDIFEDIETAMTVQAYYTAENGDRVPNSPELRLKKSKYKC
jgi:hypothetical protein